MRVKNRKTIWNLSLKSFRASGKRNLIAVVAIVLTTVLFTSLFTIVMSLNESYQTYTFRQIGGYAHGTFKDVTDKQAEEIKGHKKVKAAGERIVAGIIAEGVFARVPAEVSYMDENNTKWSYIDLKEGREPEGEKEIILDDAALELLGVTPELGAEITLTYQVSDKKQNGGVRTDTFTLVGWWEYDPVMPVHYINVSRAYMEQLERDMTGEGLEPFRRDLNVMLSSSLDIDGTMEEIEEDLGYQRDDPEADTYLNYGVNWGYTTAQAASADHPAAGPSAVRDRLSAGADRRLAGGIRPGACGPCQDQPGDDPDRGQQFAPDLCGVRAVRGGDGAAFLRAAGPDGGESLSRGGGKIYGNRHFFPEGAKKQPGRDRRDGFCQPGKE